jgi:hypothetical protein
VLDRLALVTVINGPIISENKFVTCHAFAPKPKAFY